MTIRLPNAAAPATHSASAPEARGLAPTSIAEAVVAAARIAQIPWEFRPLKDRVGIISRLRGEVARHARSLAASVQIPERLHESDTLAAEVLPLAEAAAWLSVSSVPLLSPKTVSTRGRPFWLGGVRLEMRRRAWGVVLIVGPANYPLFLPGAQALQALVAGNAVVVKPGRGGRPAMLALRERLLAAGLPEGLFEVLSEDPEDVAASFAAGIDFVVLTGSARSGRAVLALAAERGVPSIVELSGCDAVFVLPSADLDRAAACIAYAMRLNGGQTCLAPRRLFAPAALRRDLLGRLSLAVAKLGRIPVDPQAAAVAEPLVHAGLAAGAKPLVGGVAEDGKTIRYPLVLDEVPPESPLAQADLFVPILCVLTAADPEAALQQDAQCPYKLGAAVFGGADAAAFARRLSAGSVTVNDLVAPTADPRAPFGGAGASGFGATRGAEGLLALTRPQAILVQGWSKLRHLDPPGDRQAETVLHLIGALHSPTLWERMKGWVGLIRSDAGSTESKS